MPENSSCSGASSCSKESCEGCSHNSQNPQSMLEAMNAYSNIKHVIGVVSEKECIRMRQKKESKSFPSIF